MNKNNILIIINGSGGSGKSTFCTFCKEYCEKNYKNEVMVAELSTIDWPKEVARFCGWKETKTKKDRKFLSDLKKALEEWDNSPMLAVMSQIEKIDNGKINIYFINCREPKNISEIIKYNKENNNYQLYTLLIKNDNVPIIESNESDANVQNFNYNGVIYNNYR